MALEWKDKVDGVDEILADDINAIAHAVIDNERNISNKVSKEDGKGLSSNDFTNEYKNKVDNFKSPVESVAGKIGDVILDKNDVGLSQVDNTSDKDKPISKAMQGALDKKANKSDISNVYRFKGSVESFDDLPIGNNIEISKPNGEVIVVEGEGYASYFDFKEDTKEVSFSGEIDAEYSDFYSSVIIPIPDVELSEGYYVVELISEGLNYCPEIYHIFTLHKYVTNIMENQVYVDKPIMLHLTEKTTFKYLNWEMNGQYFVTNADFKIKGVSFRKVNYKEEFGMNPEKYPFLESGDVYNALDTDINYAWTGEKWDSLGGEHKDLEARADIEALETQMGDIETVLDSIIEIQNGLIGGEEVWV